MAEGSSLSPRVCQRPISRSYPPGCGGPNLVPKEGDCVRMASADPFLTLLCLSPSYPPQRVCVLEEGAKTAIDSGVPGHSSAPDSGFTSITILRPSPTWSGPQEAKCTANADAQRTPARHTAPPSPECWGSPRKAGKGPKLKVQTCTEMQTKKQKSREHRSHECFLLQPCHHQSLRVGRDLESYSLVPSAGTRGAAPRRMLSPPILPAPRHTCVS